MKPWLVLAGVVGSMGFTVLARADEGPPPSEPVPVATNVDDGIPPRPPFQVRAVAEGGFFGAFSNFGAFGSDATRVDLRRAAGQDNLSFYTRWSAELDLGRRHTFVFLYQPLTTSGTYVPDTPVRIDGTTFDAGIPIHTSFGFPFYRLSWLFRVYDGDSDDVQLGFTGQIRNANYTFEQSGTRFGRSADVGFVPALKARYTRELSDTVFAGLEADGIYAPISVLNGSDNDTVGAILDASARVGVRLRPQASVFLNLRYLGGGATNTDPNDYARNWLHFFFVGLGASYELVPRP